jgi:hypothetical protein
LAAAASVSQSVLVAAGRKDAIMGVALVFAGFAFLCNLPTNPFVARPEPATLEYLQDKWLTVLTDEPMTYPRMFQVS